MQIKQLRKDLTTKLIRGNVDTRIRKLEENDYEAIVLAFAGVQMLGKKEKKFHKSFQSKKFYQVLVKELLQYKVE